ncbi:TetR/AcrR family transcriptional regulator [Pseudonocardia sp. NPDC049154]|uniref:TetR/AcrR family transcriptional regulator n=1 Tax=Pseudonocardia sp. NPDC049154 TaxID=3155501 RepID=UPI0033C4D617
MPPSRTSSRAPTGATPREAILSAATELFGENGYTGTSMRDIATAVGVLPGSLYAHIQSKDAVLLEIIEGGVDRFVAAADEIEAQRPPATEALRLAVRAHLRIVADNPGRTLIVFHQWRFLTEPHRTRLREKRRSYEKFFTRAVAAGVASGEFSADVDVKVAVLGLLGALNWTPEWYSPDGPATPDELAAKLADALLGGLRARS